MILTNLVSKLDLMNIGLFIVNTNIYIFMYFVETSMVYLIMDTLLYKVFRL